MSRILFHCTVEIQNGFAKNQGGSAKDLARDARIARVLKLSGMIKKHNIRDFKRVYILQRNSISKDPKFEEKLDFVIKTMQQHSAGKKSIKTKIIFYVLFYVSWLIWSRLDMVKEYVADHFFGNDNREILELIEKSFENILNEIKKIKYFEPAPSVILIILIAAIGMIPVLAVIFTGRS